MFERLREDVNRVIWWYQNVCLLFRGFVIFFIIMSQLHDQNMSITYPFPTCRRFLTQKQQTTFENIVPKGVIAHDEQFHLWPQCFQHYLTIKLAFMENFHYFVTMVSKSSAADVLYVGKGNTDKHHLSCVHRVAHPK